MICLTSDIHHMRLNTGNQKHCSISEVEVALLYLEMLEEYGISSTFFLTGKLFEYEWNYVSKICESKNIEIAGHNYSAFKPEWCHRIFNKVFNSYNGPAWIQKSDAMKTINVIKEKASTKITSWRNHMYMHGPHTEKVLSDCGINICSDGVVKNSNGPVLHDTGIYNFPINIMPDHEHLYHAERTPEWVAKWQKRYSWSDDYGSQSYYIEEWTDRVLFELEEHENKKMISNMIIHPITMYLCDEFRSLEKILKYISKCKSIKMSEVLQFP